MEDFSIFSFKSDVSGKFQILKSAWRAMRNRCFILPAFDGCCFLCRIIMPITVLPPPGEKISTLVLESANSNENTFSGGEFVHPERQCFFTYDDIRIRSDEATWWRNENG